MTARSHVRVSAFILALGGAVLAGPAPAAAQAVAAFVNGTPITTYDVEQRMRINKAIGARGADRAGALRDLIDDQIKINEARRVGYRLTEAHVDEQMSRIASSNRQSMYDFVKNLGNANIDTNAYRHKLAADYSWELAVQHRQRGAGGTESDPLFAPKTGSGVKVTDFSLTSVIFIVPQGVSAGQRSRDAAAARSRFNGCEAGLEAMRNTRDVVVRPPVRRASSSLNKQLADLLNKTPVGKLTPPMGSDQGIEMIAVCEKTERIDHTITSPAQKEAKAKSKASEADEYLKSLRAKTVIQYKR